MFGDVMDKTILLNLTTFGHWEYLDFDFNSIVRQNDKYYIANDSGIFEITQPDIPTVIGEIRTGRLPFNETLVSYMHDLYADCRGAMDIEITTIVDEDREIEYEFAVRPDKEKKHCKRFQFARGVKGNCWSLIIRNKTGSRFDITSINPIPLQAKRSK